jgi:5-methylcytosine-specific restriction endonuclease McrA
MTADAFPLEVDEAHIRREKAKARELRQSQWWKNRRGRGVCHYCGQRVPPRELTMDHVVPIVRGGRSTKGNVVPCCKTCNSQKQSRLPTEWQEYLEHLATRDPRR